MWVRPESVTSRNTNQSEQPRGVDGQAAKCVQENPLPGDLSDFSHRHSDVGHSDRHWGGGGACLRALGLLHLVVAGWMAFRGKSGMPTPPHVVFAIFFLLKSWKHSARTKHFFKSKIASNPWSKKHGRNGRIFNNQMVADLAPSKHAAICVQGTL